MRSSSSAPLSAQNDRAERTWPLRRVSWDMPIPSRGFVSHYGAAFILIVVCLVGAILSPEFLTPSNLLNVLRQNSMLALMALGMTAVILAGGIDLSVGSVLALAGVTTAALSAYGSTVAIVGGVSVGLLIGLLNGVLIAPLRLPPFIVTLATMIAARGAALGFTGEHSVPVAPTAAGIAWLGQGWIGDIPVPVIVFAVAYLIGWGYLRYTRSGRHLYAVGDDEEAARLLGLRVDRLLVGVYAACGALAGLAGVVLAGRLGAGQPVAGMGWELDAIAAVVVGGTLLTGGYGGAGRTLTGVLLLGVILNLLNLDGTLSPWWQNVVRGVFLLVVVLISGARPRRSAHA